MSAPVNASFNPKVSSSRLLAQSEGFWIVALSCFILGQTLAFYYTAQTWLFEPRYVLGFSLIFLGLLLLSNQRWVLRISLWWMALLLGGLYTTCFSFHPGPHDVSRWIPTAPNPWAQQEISGLLLQTESVGQRQKSQKAFLQVDHVNDQPAQGKLSVWVDAEVLDEKTAPIWQVGQRLSVTGQLRKPQPALLPGGFDEARYLKTQHCAAVLEHVNQVRQVRLLPTPKASGFYSITSVHAWLLKTLQATRARMVQTFSGVYPSPQAEILGGMVLGDEAIPVDKTTYQQFVNTGLVHLLAASGMNVTVMAGLAFIIGRLFRLPRKPQLILAMLLVGVFTLLSGMPPSVLRATAMLELALILKLFRQSLSAILLVLAAITGLLLLQPDTIGRVGFQFSAIITLGLVSVLPLWQQGLGFYVSRWLAGIILIPLVAQLWVLPLLLVYFNQFPLHSVGLNILAVPLVVPLTAIGFTAGALSLIWPPAAQAMALLAAPFLKALMALVTWGNAVLAQWPGLMLQVPSPPVGWVLGAYVALLFAPRLWQTTQPFNRKLATTLAMIALLLLPTCFQQLEAAGFPVLDSFLGSSAPALH